MASVHKHLVQFIYSEYYGIYTTLGVAGFSEQNNKHYRNQR